MPFPLALVPVHLELRVPGWLQTDSAKMEPAQRSHRGARGWERRAWGGAEAIAQPGGEDSPGGAVQLPELGPGSARNAQGKVRRQQAQGGLGNTIQTYVRAFPPVNDQQGSWEVSQAALCSAHSTYPCFGQGVGLETHSSPF